MKKCNIETFAPVENNPHFADKDKVKPSNIPEKQVLSINKSDRVINTPKYRISVRKK